MSIAQTNLEEQMASWPDGWNGYDALAPRKDLIEQAKTWLTSFHGHVGKLWLTPSITGSGVGGVCIEWSCGARKITVFIEDYDIWCLKVWGPDCAIEMEEGDANLPQFLNVWYWLRSTDEQH